ncbi:DUF2889 domain-containing protein [Cupriavidus numazuensis]|uniref:DUF2889 domain-containing protein n=1 Tax=Cupriavidus numazuensis TaxID=221992 RepID=A0ABN7QGH2_9BURK|nr:DUF2889 domain-containing protein [Cupriavidus numazuensis]CAG2160620.1 hypothetical protein LMG26411_07622 [Cupriavidus numazuensis]
MSFTTPQPRRHVHTRTVRCEGYKRDDGLWDIEGRVTDQKPFQYTEPIRGLRAAESESHHMRIRLTVDNDMVVHAIEVDMPSTPYLSCSEAISNYQALVGKRIDRTWRESVKSAVGAERGCTHARELLFPLATTAFQTVFGWQEGDARNSHMFEATEKPAFIGHCVGWAVGGPQVARFYPQFAKPK